MAPHRIRPITRYGVAALSSAAAFGAAIWLRDPWTRLSPFFVFYAAVAVSSWYGGLGPGLVAVAAGAVAANLYLLGTHGPQQIDHAEGVARLVVFTLIGVLIASLNGALHRAKRRYEVQAAAARMSEAHVQRNQEHLRAVGAELMIAEERERRRIATVLHDSVVQLLALAKLKVDAARRATQGNNTERLSEVYELIDQAITQARTLTADISPPVLYELGLPSAIQWLGDRMRADHGLPFELEWDHGPLNLSEETRIVLYQAVRELLFNVVKHARASTCRVRIHPDPDSGTLEIIVQDNGGGFAAAPAAAPDYSKGGFGLFNIRQRLARLGGWVKIDARPGGGTTVIVTVPLDRAKEGAA